jgi:hypothetical protein
MKVQTREHTTILTMKTKTILVASSSMLAAGMAHGTIITSTFNVTVDTSSSGFQFDLDGDGITDFNVLFDGNNSVKPCVVGVNSSNGYPGSFPNPEPMVFNELNMNPVAPASNDNNGIPVMPIGTLISSSPITVGTNTLTPGDLGGDTHGKNEGYMYQNGELNVVGQWPSTQDTFGYVGLAMVNTNATPASTNYGWVYIELNYTLASPTLTIINCGYEDIAGSNILAGQEGPINIPVIYIPPVSQTDPLGTTVNMNVVALGAPAPVYQWMAGTVGSGIYTNLQNAGEFSGVNTPSLTISNISTADQLDYVVSVSNTNGFTNSLPATLTVIPVQLVGPVPAQQVIYAGYPAQFNVTDIGGVAITNSWQMNGAKLLNGATFSGVTTTNLLIPSVAPAVLGNYRAIASTAEGSVTSSVAPLGIVYPDGSLYEAAVRSYGAVDYYRFDEISGTNAWDFIGGNNGTYGSDAVYMNAGPTAATGFPGFANTNYAATFQSLDPNNLLTCLPWNLNTNAVTITAWIYPVYNQGNAGIVFTVGANSMINGIRYDGGYLNTNGIDDGDIGYTWANGSSTWDSGITAPHNQWSLVALAVSPTNTTLYIINTNGAQSAVNNTGTNASQAFDATEYIGNYPQGESSPGANNFNGQIDEVAIFKSALSSNQINALFASGLGQETVPPVLSIAPVGSSSQVHWTGGVLLQATNALGPWTTNTSSSPYTVSPTNPQQFFRAKQ